MKKVFIIISILVSTFAYSISSFTVCNSIMDNTMRLQCLTGANGYYEARPLRACLSFNEDIDRRDCMDLIVDKTYTKKETSSCIMENDQSMRFFCLLIMGKVINTNEENISEKKRINLMATKALEELKYGDLRITKRILQKLKEMTSY